MTIQGKKSFFRFMVSRFIRLYPAVFLIVPIAYLVGLYTNLKNDRILPHNLIPSFLLFDPNVLNQITDINYQYVIDVMWSISAEIYFYSLIGFLFFLLKDMNKILFALVLISSASSSANYLRFFGIQGEPLEFFLKFSDLFNWATLIYFTFGVLFYLRKNHGIIIKWYVLLILIVNLVATEKITHGGSMVGFGAGSVVVMMFLAVQKIGITWRGLVWIGDASYEIYLLHNPILSFMRNNFPQVANNNSVLSQIIVLLVVIFLSILISEFYSKPMTRKLRTHYSL
jgi:peptidoglycan/LPS O-acetylase OafA/YrhL